MTVCMLNFLPNYVHILMYTNYVHIFMYTNYVHILMVIFLPNYTMYVHHTDKRMVLANSLSTPNLPIHYVKEAHSLLEIRCCCCA
jgi:hypothetical protein